MASSGNFCTWNPLVKGTENVSSGNCKLDMTTGNRGALGNFEIPLTGKWYFEGYIKMAANLEGVIGVSDAEVDLQSSRGGKNDGNTEALNFSQYSGSNYYAIKIDGGSEDAGGKIDLGTTDNAVIGVAVNRDDNELKLYANNTLRFTLTLSATTKYFPWCGVGGGTNSSVFVYLNAGQDSTFGGNKTAGGNADGNGFGDFAYSPPTGFLALCSANLPISDDIDPAQTDDDYPQKQFNVVTYTGNGSTQSINVGFKPDFLWFKNRGSSNSWVMFNSTRGTTKTLTSNGTGVEQTGAYTNLDSFTSTGFDLDGGGTGDVNQSSASLMAICWRANGGTTSSNTDGALTSTVQANQAAGFSISTYTSNGSGSSFGHGLGAAPDWFMLKKLDNQARNWYCWHKSLATPTTGYIRLNLNNAQGNDTQWDSTLPDSTKIYVNNSTTEVNNPSGDSYICFAWRGIEGYSKFESYEGNGNSDGPFVYTGFRPRLLFIKNASTGGRYWTVIDSARSTFNLADDIINWDQNIAEYDSSARGVDILSNGFKIRGNDSDNNTSGDTYIYGAWGDVPFKYNNTF